MTAHLRKRAHGMPILYTKNYKDFEVRKDTPSSELLVSFAGYKSANRCLPGDEVSWDGERCQLIQRGKHTSIVGTLELTNKCIYGHTARGNRLYLFHPFSSHYPPMRVSCSERNTFTNKLMMVQFQDWEAHEAMPRGNSVRVFGTCGDIDAERQALIWHYGLPQHSKAVFDLPMEAIYQKNLDRVELNGLTINIDPQGCRDIDDVITFRQINMEEWELIITIADVAEFIEEGSLADTFAKEKGQTLYQDGKAVVPILPSYLSEDQISLLPGQERLGVSLFCTWNTKTSTLKPIYFDLTQLMNQKTYTYESIIEASEIPLEILRNVASALKGTDTSDSHEWVEELMLLYNREVAKALLREKTGLLRKHDAADMQKLTLYEAIHPDLRFLAFTSAQYAPTEEGLFHASLGSVPYAHASSPLRRYADLVNQRALKAILRGHRWHPTRQELADHLNVKQKQQKHHDRDLFFLTQIVKSNIGKKPAIVIASTKEKTKVYVPAWKRIVSVKTEVPFSIQENVSLEYYADLQKPRWDERMVFRLQPKL